jgi:hypothetical protein
MNKKFIIIAGIVLVTGLLFITGCPTGGTETTEGGTENKPEVTMNEMNSPIRKVDFKNFTFTKATDSKEKQEFTLKDGKLEKTEKSAELSLGEVKYADVTGDKKEEAIVEIKTRVKDQDKLNSVYVYTLEDEDPKLIMNFDSSEKAMLKNVGSDNGSLLVEMFGDAKFENGKWLVTVPKDKLDKENQPTIFTKTQLKWNGKEFAVEGKPEIVQVGAKTEEVASKNKEAEPKTKVSEGKDKETEPKVKEEKKDEKAKDKDAESATKAKG